MTPFVASAVVSTAVTDLINGIALLLAYLHLRKVLPVGQRESRHWLHFLLMASLACILGCVTHIYFWSFSMMFLLWLVLNIALMEAAHGFFMLGICTLSGAKRPTRKEQCLLRIGELIVQLIMIRVMLAHWHPIQLLVIFVLLLIVPGLYCVIRLALRGHRGSKTLLYFILPLIPCIAAQVLGYHEEKVIGSLNVDGLCHLFILIDIPIVCAAAKRWNSTAKCVA